jgi:cytochrome c
MLRLPDRQHAGGPLAPALRHDAGPPLRGGRDGSRRERRTLRRRNLPLPALRDEVTASAGGTAGTTGDQCRRHVAAAAALAALAACGGEAPDGRRAAGADPERGLALIAEHGCHACHAIPGVQGPKGVIGPPLDDFGKRVMIVGSVPNTPENLTRWIAHPTRMLPSTAMPEMGLTEEEARDIAAYLHELR